MRVTASTHVGESSLSEENDIFVITPEDGKMESYCESPQWCLSLSIAPSINLQDSTDLII